MEWWIGIIISSILPAATEGRLQAEIDVLLGVEADNEGGDVDDLQHGEHEGGTWLGEVTWSVTPHADPAPDTCGQHQTRVASVSCFMTVAGHVASKFDVVHDIDLLDKRAGSWSPLCPAHTCFRTRMCLCLMRTRAWWMDLASPSLNTCTTNISGI